MTAKHIADLPGNELVEQQNLASRVDRLLAIVHELGNQLAGREPARGVKLQLLHELFPGEGRGDFEELIEDSVADGLVPLRVEARNTAGKVGPVTVLGLDVLGVLGDAVVDGVDGFDKVPVQERIDEGDIRVLDGYSKLLGDDLVAKMPWRKVQQKIKED